MKCFTGLPSYAHLLWLVSLMSPLIRGQANLTSEDQITMTLMKLKLNLTVQSLAFIFKSSYPFSDADSVSDCERGWVAKTYNWD